MLAPSGQRPHASAACAASAAVRTERAPAFPRQGGPSPGWTIARSLKRRREPAPRLRTLSGLPRWVSRSTSSRPSATARANARVSRRETASLAMMPEETRASRTSGNIHQTSTAAAARVKRGARAASRSGSASWRPKGESRLFRLRTEISDCSSPGRRTRTQRARARSGRGRDPRAARRPRRWRDRSSKASRYRWNAVSGSPAASSISPASARRALPTRERAGSPPRCVPAPPPTGARRRRPGPWRRGRRARTREALRRAKSVPAAPPFVRAPAGTGDSPPPAFRRGR